MRPNAPNRFAIVASQQDTQVDELRDRHFKPLKHLFQVQLRDRQLLCFAKRQMTQQDIGAKGKRVHVLGAGRIHQAGLH